MNPFEVWRDPETKVEFCFSHSDEKFTTGVMYIPPGVTLSKHNRPKAFENLMQVSGKCKMTVFDLDGDGSFDKVLSHGDTIRMERGQYHIHANPFEEGSYTLFKAEGDITEIVAALRELRGNWLVSEKYSI